MCVSWTPSGVSTRVAAAVVVPLSCARATLPLAGVGRSLPRERMYLYRLAFRGWFRFCFVGVGIYTQVHFFLAFFQDSWCIICSVWRIEEKAICTVVCYGSEVCNVGMQRN